MLSANNFSDFLHSKKEQLKQVESQCETIQQNILDKKCEVWLDSILSRVLLCYGLLDRTSVSFYVPWANKYFPRIEDFSPIIKLCNKVIKNYGSVLGLSYSSDFPSNDEQAEILWNAFQNRDRMVQMFQEKGYRVELELRRNRMNLTVYLED